MTPKPSNRKPGPPHVALFIETSINYGRGLLRGIARYLRQHGPWSVYLEQREFGAALPAWVESWAGDGIITRSDDPRILSVGVPTVGLFDRIDDDLGLPLILNDSTVVGRQAAEHLVGRGFKHCAYFGVAGEYWSKMRLEGARAVLGPVGGSLDAFLVDRGGGPDWEADRESLADWIAELPKPLGLIACNDIHALQALDACARRGLRVPEEVAVIGADDDPELCDFSEPPLSSVAFQAERIGYEAAALLDRMMQGEDAPPEPVFIEPAGVAVRRSTDTLAIDDAVVAQALHVIRREACRGLSVEDVLDEVPVSRRTLEQRFRKVLGRSPKEQILRERIDRAKVLLIETELPVTAIGPRVGVKQPAYFSSVFRRMTGKTPSAYRRAARGE